MVPDWVVIILVLLVGGLALFFIPSYLTWRAVKQVISKFQRYHAIGASNAKTLDELELRPRPFWQRMMYTRDYKPRALEILTRAKVIHVTENGRLYLSEEAYVSSKYYRPN